VIRAVPLPVRREQAAGSKAARGMPAFPESLLGRELQACKPELEPGKLVETVIKSRICGYVVPEKETA